MSEFPQFPGCTCHDLIAEGSCGTVYAGTWEEETDVAIKVFKPEAINRDYLKHCLDQLRSGDLHPGILPIYDHDLDGDPGYCVMGLRLEHTQESTESRTLETICGQIPPQDAWELIEQIAEAVSHAHALGIVHCGLKTSNIFLVSEGENLRAQVSDFGQGWLGGVGRLALNDHTFYASPEQLEHPEQLFEKDVRYWDVYAFGVVAYRLLTGYFPRFEDELDALREQIEQDPELPIVFDPGVYATHAQKYPEILWPDAPRDRAEADRRAVIERCLQLNPEDRYADLGNVLDSLATVADFSSDKPAHTSEVDGIEADNEAPEYAKMAPPASPLAPIRVSPEDSASGSSLLTRLIPWVLVALLTAFGGLLYKLYSDTKNDLAVAESELASTQGTIEEFSGELASRTEQEQKTASLAEESHLEAGTARAEKLRAQRNLAKAQDTADFFFSEFIESGSEKADTPERRIAFERAENFYQSVLAGSEGDPALLDSVARATLNLALIQSGLGKANEADAGYDKAITSITKLISEAPDSPAADDHRLRLAKARLSAGKLRIASGNYEQSISLLETASEEYRPFASRLASDPILRHSVAEVYQLTGKALRNVARFDDATAQLGRAIELLTSAEENPNNAPNDALLLSKAYFERGRCRLETSEFVKGANDHVKAVDILLALNELDPEAPAYRHELGINYWALGEMLAKSAEWNQAGQAHSEAVKFLKSLVEQYPNTPEYKMALARDYAAVGSLLRDQGSPEKALDYQRGTVVFINEVVTKAATTDLDRHELAVNRGIYAELLAAADKIPDATAEARQAVTMAEEIRIKQAAGSFLRKKFQISLAELYGTLGDISEKGKNKEEAVTSFKKAVETWQQLTTAGHQDEVIVTGLQWSIERLTSLDPTAMENDSADADENTEGA